MTQLRRARDLLQKVLVYSAFGAIVGVSVVALSIEALVAVFQFNHGAPEHLPYAAAIGLMAAALLVAWGVFIWLNQSAERLEPEAMERTKQEDTKLE